MIVLFTVTQFYVTHEYFEYRYNNKDITLEMDIEIIGMFSVKGKFVNSDNLSEVKNMVYLCSRYGTGHLKSQYSFCPGNAGRGSCKGAEGGGGRPHFDFI